MIGLINSSKNLGHGHTVHHRSYMSWLDFSIYL